MTAVETYHTVTTSTTTTTSSRVTRRLSKTPFEVAEAAAEDKLGRNSKVTPLKIISLDEFDDLISNLSKQELDELEHALIDPDDSSTPANLRCFYRCEKQISNCVDRRAMLLSLREAAINLPDREDRVKFVPGTKRGKKFVPKAEVLLTDAAPEEVQEAQIEEDSHHLSPEEQRVYDDFCSCASLDDVRDMADILGLTYQDDCLATTLQKYPDPLPNAADVEETIRRVARNDQDLVQVNFNNVKGILPSQWQRLCEALRSNDRVESLSAANCDITDPIAAMLCECFEGNKGLRKVTLDSNFISGEMVVRLIFSTAKMQTVEEMRLSNQLNCRYLGNRVETEIANILPKVPQLVKLGITMEFRDTLNRTAVQLQKNLDRRRKNEKIKQREEK